MDYCLGQVAVFVHALFMLLILYDVWCHYCVHLEERLDKSPHLHKPPQMSIMGGIDQLSKKVSGDERLHRHSVVADVVAMVECVVNSMHTAVPIGWLYVWMQAGMLPSVIGLVLTKPLYFTTLSTLARSQFSQGNAMAALIQASAQGWGARQE